MYERETLLKQISGAQFAAWELHMYLDTHPNDTSALNSYKKYENQAKELIIKYENMFGPLVSSNIYGDKRWEWINNPWPWEYQGGKY